uniref:Ammonium_transp domain-containing protein n=1 Tax=Macrostomum lignano TaxID=282301 RepID=A0A1I8I3N9_9PLAT
MVKNVIDVLFGGLTYWMFGYAFSFGNAPGSNPFIGWGDFFLDATPDEMGQKFTTFIFQMSFATTATTIVSGAMAERTKLSAYILFSLLNTIIYCIPAHWIWGKKGFLNDLGVVDIAGVGPVHVLGGVTGLVATVLLKPRTGRFGESGGDYSHPAPQMGCPTNVMLGLFMLWWGWLGFNCGSTFGIRGGKWKLAARSAVTTIMASVGGGLSSLGLTFAICRGKYDIADIVNGVLGGLVSITGMCALAHPWESLVIGFIAGLFTIGTARLVSRLRIDDPVGVIPVHMVCGVWGLLATGLFVDKVINL